MNWAFAVQPPVEISRSPSAATTKSASGMGPVGMWVNGVAIFNVLDGASYSNSAGADEGGGGVSPRATSISAASLERGPLAAGSLASAYAEFSATLAGSTESASGTTWPVTLAGTTVTVTDSTGAHCLPESSTYRRPRSITRCHRGRRRARKSDHHDRRLIGFGNCEYRRDISRHLQSERRWARRGSDADRQRKLAGPPHRHRDHPVNVSPARST